MNANANRRPVRPIAPVPTGFRDYAARRREPGCLIPAIVILLALVVGGYFACRRYGLSLSALLDKLQRRHADVQIIDPSQGLDKQPVEAPKSVVTNVVEEPPPPPPPKTAAELRAEADEAQRTLDQEISRAREASKGKELPGFATVRFGDVVQGPSIATEPVHDGAGDDGFAYLMFGPKLKTPFRKFGSQPLVRVTPKTRRIFQIEFAQDIARQPGWTLNPETTNLVEILSGKLRREPFALDVEKYPLGNREFVFPLGDTTLTVGEYGGARLKLIAEHAGLKAEARAEAEELRQAARAEEVRTKALSSDKYPNSGMVKFGRVRVRNGTPRAFCGIVFGSTPPYCAKVSAPASSAARKGFFIDYRKVKCAPFMNFDHGKAVVSDINDAVVAVHLHSNGADNGLTDAEYFALARGAIERHYKAQPRETKGDGPIPEVTYAVGDLEITLGLDPKGGLRLSAVNVALSQAW